MKLNKDVLLQCHTMFSDNYGSFIASVLNHKVTKHPLIIFYDEYEKNVYYLKGQTFKNQSFLKDIEHPFYKIEIKEEDEYFYPTSQSNENYTYNDTIFDTSTIFRMKLETFIEEFELNESYRYRVVNEEHQFKILKSLQKNFKNNDIALKEVFVENNLYEDSDGLFYKLEHVSHYRYVSHRYLVRNLEYENERVSHLKRDEIIKQYNIDVRQKQGSLLGLQQIISSALYDFKCRNKQYTNELRKLLQDLNQKQVNQR